MADLNQVPLLTEDLPPNSVVLQSPKAIVYLGKNSSSCRTSLRVVLFASYISNQVGTAHVSTKSYDDVAV